MYLESSASQEQVLCQTSGLKGSCKQSPEADRSHRQVVCHHTITDVSIKAG